MSPIMYFLTGMLKTLLYLLAVFVVILPTYIWVQIFVIIVVSALNAFISYMTKESEITVIKKMIWAIGSTDYFGREDFD